MTMTTALEISLGMQIACDVPARLQQRGSVVLTCAEAEGGWALKIWLERQAREAAATSAFAVTHLLTMPMRSTMICTMRRPQSSAAADLMMCALASLMESLARDSPPSSLRSLAYSTSRLSFSVASAFGSSAAAPQDMGDGSVQCPQL